MSEPLQYASDRAKYRKRSRVRWVVGGFLFATTVINYTDRETINALAPILVAKFQWSNSEFALLLIAFRIGYTIMQGVGGRLFDILGSRRMYSLVVSFYSVVAICTSFAQGLWSFGICRFLLGLGEGPNQPGAAKTAAEWFPAKERAWALALSDSGSSIGGAIAPFLVLYVYHLFGTWRPAFALIGSFGFVWIFLWRWHYRSPEMHPGVSVEELNYIVENRPDPRGAQVPIRWRNLIGYRQTWGIILGRFFLDPFWFFIADWFALYLFSKGFRIEQSVLGFWTPFICAGLGNFFGGGLSSYLISRGWPVSKARHAVLLIFGPSIACLLFALHMTHYWSLLLLFSYASFAYAACSTMFLSLPTDAFVPSAVGTVSGMAGTGAGIGTLISTLLIGRITDRTSFAPIVAAAAIIPCIATLLFVSLVRSPKRLDPKGLLITF